LISQNDDWSNDQYFAIFQTGIAPTEAREAAILTNLAPGNYTVIVKGHNGGTDVGLVEVYNLK